MSHDPQQGLKVRCFFDPFKGFMDVGVIGPDGLGDCWEGSKGKEDSCALGRDLHAVGG
jgi:hypothetical protein